MEHEASALLASAASEESLKLAVSDPLKLKDIELLLEVELDSSTLDHAVLLDPVLNHIPASLPVFSVATLPIFPLKPDTEGS